MARTNRALPINAAPRAGEAFEDIDNFELPASAADIIPGETVPVVANENAEIPADGDMPGELPEGAMAGMERTAPFEMASPAETVAAEKAGLALPDAAADIIPGETIPAVADGHAGIPADGGMPGELPEGAMAGMERTAPFEMVSPAETVAAEKAGLELPDTAAGIIPGETIPAVADGHATVPSVEEILAALPTPPAHDFEDDLLELPQESMAEERGNFGTHGASFEDRGGNFEDHAGNFDDFSEANDFF
ncbi:hypothetical protein ACFFUT_17075 [Pseudohalocynthiibacter aestuariivivens]|uniref:Uncharacterized protein n=1 Tax=Pseudohalocynthiibacter aestuariivivens TaxID=1591409 RepID=A0ABV5JJ89_9RHOB|nr:hypothetical protein [Pseudohalocynthiibacter aestuariivivens]MBS9716737.1 hypothetical protein [Pseudohalocynthiibacter aestuariivivens]